jgi:hypothetical protein
MMSLERGGLVQVIVTRQEPCPELHIILLIQTSILTFLTSQTDISNQVLPVLHQPCMTQLDFLLTLVTQSTINNPFTLPILFLLHTYITTTHPPFNGLGHSLIIFKDIHTTTTEIITQGHYPITILIPALPLVTILLVGAHKFQSKTLNMEQDQDMLHFLVDLVPPGQVSNNNLVVLVWQEIPLPPPSLFNYQQEQRILFMMVLGLGPLQMEAVISTLTNH